MSSVVCIIIDQKPKCDVLESAHEHETPYLVEVQIVGGGHLKRLEEKFNPTISEMMPSLEMADPPPSPDSLSENEVLTSSAVPKSHKAPPTLAVFSANMDSSIRSRPAVLCIAPPIAVAELPTNLQR